MKRIEEKVKDIVEVRLHATVTDFGIDPLRTLTGYHFTDVTADMMGKWINSVSRVVNGGGFGLALAGFRGVGKSHFLAAFAAMLLHPEYRSRVSDSLVSSAAQNLARKSYAVAFVRRGSHPTLFSELKDALAPVIGSNPESLSNSLHEILVRANESTGDLPLVLLIDTAFERGARVARDDGAVLSEIAEIAKTLGIFVGIALDDDISGADGINSAISRSFVIDYLDQEHLYKIVDNHIFPKNSRMQPVLHDIYDYYRNAVPGFRWSEERFRSLYPLHPSIMEIAPFVRLYMHDFALLGFASEAGSRILGRPANSLIAPDEVFDKAEQHLRGVDALRAAFSAFDKVNDFVIAKIPVMKRLQAKLILKGLFLFSLNDESSTASEIGASMLIFDEHDPLATVQYVETILTGFVDAVPGQMRVQTDSAGNRRYAFIVDGKDNLKSALQAAAVKVPDDVVMGILRKQMEERYSDCDFGRSSGDSDPSASDCVLSWRGGLRKGKVLWNLDGVADSPVVATVGPDWVAAVEVRERAEKRHLPGGPVPVVSWIPDALRDDETLAIKRYHALMTDPEIRNEFQEHLPAAIQSHMVAVEKIFQRAFLEEGVLMIEGFEYNFDEEARGAQSHSQIFTIMLESLFEGRFPLHPYFPQIIRMKDVSTLVADLFGGARPILDEVQELAARLAVPLGIVTKPNSVLIPAESDVLRELPLVGEILTVAKPDSDGVVALDAVFRTLSAAPYGLGREAGYLLLAAMVSGRLFEFVTSNGDRISHRSLDLKLIWEDIVGIAPPAGSGYSSERLVMWARLLTSKGSLGSLNKDSDRQIIVDALGDWHQQWTNDRLPDRFDRVGDDLLNTKIWHLARTSIKAFRIVAESITTVLDNSVAVEECLQRIGDAFSDSEVEFAKFNDELRVVEDFIVGAALREDIIGWIALCEYTGDVALDRLRLEVEMAIRPGRYEPSALSNVDLSNLWVKFQKAYSEYFLVKHESLLATPMLRDKLNEILSTDLWWEFDSLSDIPGFDPNFRANTTRIVREIRKLDCHHDTREILRTSPSCGCPFTLGTAERIEALPDELWRAVNQGLISFRGVLLARKGEALVQLSRIMASTDDPIERSAIVELTKYIGGDQEFRRLTDGELRLVRLAFGNLDVTERDNPGVILNVPGMPVLTESAQELDALIESMPS